MDRWVALPGVGAGNGDFGMGGGFEGVDWVGGGGIEGDDFSAEGQVIAVGSLACISTVQLRQITLTNSALNCMRRRFLLTMSAHWQYPIDPEAVQDWRA